MLPPRIIEQIRKREQDDRRPEIRPSNELPLAPPPPRRVRDESEDADRGVIVSDL
ncbi:MAG: hypothetical protein ACK5U8_09440 [Deltaproteobacteria bacterium]